MATDAAIASGGRIAQLSERTLQRLDEVLPATWSKGNPVDIIGDAPAQRYLDALEILSDDPDTDAVLFIHAPSAIIQSDRIAESLVPLVDKSTKPLFACWLGGDAVLRARQTFARAGIPTYDSPEDAVNAFLQIVNYRRNQQTLMEIPPSVSADFVPDRSAGRQIVKRAITAGRDLLTEPDAKALLAAYRIPTVDTRIARTPSESARQAMEIGFPVAIKILSPDITHKTDVGGVALDLETAEQVEATATTMLGRIKQRRPDAQIDGFTVQEMVRWTGSHELIAGASEDPIFGPVILFGQGGTAVEVIADRAVALPPLNIALARELVSRTRVAKLLAGYRDRPAADLDAIYTTLLRLSQLISDIPEIAELDINPLLANETGVLALDARVRVAPAESSASERLAIRPYPRQLEEQIEFDGSLVVLRPIRPEDEPTHRVFFEKLRPEDVRFRFFGLLREPVHTELARFTQIDYEREMAFVAVRAGDKNQQETLGVARAVTDPDNVIAEFAIVVRSDLKGKGLGSVLLNKLIGYCRERGTKQVIGHVIPDNTRMLALAEKYGFQLAKKAEEGVIEVRLSLTAI